MPKILSFKNEDVKYPLFKKFKDYWDSQDKFVKSTFVIAALLIISTPIIVKTVLTLNQHADSSPRLVGVIDNEWWAFNQKRTMSIDEFRAYMQSLKITYGANMAVLNIIPTVFYVSGGESVKQLYPKVTSIGVGQIIEYLKAAKSENMKVYIMLTTNCTISKDTWAASWHPDRPPVSDSIWWPDCKADRLAENNGEKQFTAESGKYFYNVISQVEQAAESASVLDAIAVWAPQGNFDLGAAEFSVDRNEYVSDMSDLTRVGWPRFGAGVAQKTYNPKRPLASYLIFAQPLKKPDGSLWGDPNSTYKNLKTIFKGLDWVPQPFDYLQVTYDSQASNIDSLVAAAGDFGIPSSNVVLTDFKSLSNTGKAEADINRLNPQMIWLWAHEGVSSDIYKNFIAKVSFSNSPTDTPTPTPTPGISYFGYFADATDGVGNGDYLGEIKDHANLAWIRGNWAHKLDETHQYGMKAVINPGFTLFVDPTTYQLRPDYLQRWQDFATIIMPYRQDLAAFYIADEPYLNARVKNPPIPDTVVRSSIEQVIQLIKQTFPEVPQAVIFGYPEVDSNLIIPQGYDWIGVDCYGPLDDCHGQPFSSYYETLKSKMNPSQKLIVVPQSFLRTSTLPTESDITSLLALADDYTRFIQSQQNVVAVVPFLWQTFSDHIGARDIPAVKAKYQAMGQQIRGITSTPTITPTPTQTPTSTPTPIGIESTKQIIASEDSFVSQAKPNENFNNKQYLISGDTPKKITYLKFNTSSLNRKTLVKATLVLSVGDGKHAGSTASFNIKEVLTNRWSQQLVTYNTRPAAGDNIIKKFTGVDKGKTIEVDLTNYLRSKLGQTVSLYIGTTISDWITIGSRESDPIKRPYLLIRYK